MLKRRDVVALGLAALSAPAFGQAHYPDRPIRLVVPFPPGGAFDTVARPWANMMKWLLGMVVPRSPAPCRTAIRCCSAAAGRW